MGKHMNTYPIAEHDRHRANHLNINACEERRKKEEDKKQEDEQENRGCNKRTMIS
jgi:hypothetical protein